MNSGRKYSLLEAKQKLEALCAYQERCSHELNQKMIQWCIPEEDRNALLANLIERNFLSEERFAEAFVSGKYKIKKWGRIKIKQELKRKFISDYSIKYGLNSIDADLYWDNILSLTKRKMNSLPNEEEYIRRAKTYRFLSSKGYEFDLIEDAYNEIRQSAV